MQASQIPNKFPIAFATSAGGSFSRQVPTSSQIGVQAGAASLTDGFPPLCFQPVGSGGVPPFGQDMNGILNQITAWSRWQNAGATVTYDPTFSAAVGGYPKGALVSSASTAGVMWLSTADNNTTDPDGGSAANWVSVINAVAVQTQRQNYATDTGSANAYVVALTPAITSGGGHVAGMPIRVKIKAGNTNTGASTLDEGAGAGAIVLPGNTPLIGGELLEGGIAEFFWDDTWSAFILLSAASTARAKLVGNFTIYVATTGSNSNSGLTIGSPLLTIQAALNKILSSYDLNGFTITIQLADGTYTGASIVSNSWVGGGAGNVVINGNAGNPGNVVVSTSSTDSGFTAKNSGSGFQIQNLKPQTSGTGSCVVMDDGANVLFGIGLIWGPCTGGGSHIFVGSCSTLFIANDYTIAGGAAAHIQMIGNGSIATQAGLTFTLMGTPNFSTAFAALTNGASLYYNSAPTFTGPATGTKFNISLNAVINTNSGDDHLLPGNVDGSKTTGGQYN